ncbi:hypothetical protein PVT68_10615 [Microbulbifer bruguierae]|uniref:DUF4175 domain-containing protein n=1 Tax=Microbulbifer bruguierae TaxID=3029061 RepID=A0ABY8NBR0_9GAMM|nr:hypothetical protein [Microbulbifer bruguierae]WGL15227.1 hypothetical protein PVT68_10615 [Microbulbifer bruguierae]
MSKVLNRNISPVLNKALWRWYLSGLLPYVFLSYLGGGVAWLCQQYLSMPAWILPASLGAVALALLGDPQWRPSRSQICTRLDARYPALQDSCHLLLADTQTLAPVARLQQRRAIAALQQLTESGALKAFGPHQLRSPLLAAAGAVIGLLFYSIAGQFSGLATGNTIDNNRHEARPGETGASPISDASTSIEPPAYTGLAPHSGTLELETVESSRITWRITLNSAADGLQMLAAEETLSFNSADALPSRHWQLTRTLTESDFYQLAITPAVAKSGDSGQVLLPDLYNINITADQGPEFAFDYPQDNVTIVNLEPGAESSLLNVSVAVTDDFQVVETDLLLTLASGSGENVRFRNERIKLHPQSVNGTQKAYRFAIPVDRYQIEPGDELYWYLEASDNRTPTANVVKSQHFILRWPQEEIFGLSDTEGMAIKILPEYFRSQRQLIIDTEALLADQESISAQEFRKRSESLAYEQNLLRMRYGRFLGEEDSAMEHGGDTHEATANAHEDEEGHTEKGHDDGEAHHDNHEKSSATSQQFGDASGVIAAVGHAHDSSEHATLFDPETKELLRSALNAMWSAWRDLSVIEPRASLPYQHNALRYIKQVQQASRIYLQRVGFETPPLDETRRLSGEHDQTPPPRVDRDGEHAERDQLLAMLTQVQRGEPLDEQIESTLWQLQSLRQDNALQITLAKHLRRYRQQPNCSDCRQQLSAFLYALLPAPKATPTLPRHRTTSGSYTAWLQQSAGEVKR